jgi:mRNA-degrading endonuclease RelE of RelBE toxin-antitoxin system
MAAWKVVYSEACRGQIRSLHPSLKPIVKQRIEEIREDPCLGKPLERELAGYSSCRARRFRILYRVDLSARTVQIHYVGHRRDVYELFKDLLTEVGGSEDPVP